MTAVSGACPTKQRRTKAEIETIRRTILQVLREERPATVRQVFYQCVSRGVIAKTEGEYKRTICRLLTEMRLAGRIPFSWIADNTRWQRKPITFSSLEDALRRTAEAYRRSVWDRMPVYVEVWLEKDALAGVLYEETAQWDVPLMVTKGYPSISYIYEAAEQIAFVRKPTYLYYFGDHDPSGVDIPRSVEARLREFAPRAEIHFERVAVTPQQITMFNLATRPTKGVTAARRPLRARAWRWTRSHPPRCVPWCGPALSDTLITRCCMRWKLPSGRSARSCSPSQGGKGVPHDDRIAPRRGSRDDHARAGAHRRPRWHRGAAHAWAG